MDNPYKKLSAGILYQAIYDYYDNNDKNKKESEKFFESEYCKNLCDGAGVSYNCLKRKINDKNTFINKRIEKNIILLGEGSVENDNMLEM